MPQCTDDVKRVRIAWLDVARTIAIISITINHAVNRSFAVNSGQYAEFVEISTFETLIKTIMCAFSRIGVPLFVMISGALLLPRKYDGEETKRFMRHNWLQLLITTEIWLSIMFWYKQILPGSILFHDGLVKCIIKYLMTLLFINPTTMGSMWYMEMILCVYLLIPILSVALEKIKYTFFIIPILIVVFCSFILPDINAIIKGLGHEYILVTKLDSANVFSMYVVLLLLGHFITKGNMLKAIGTSYLVIFAIISFVCFCIFQYWFFSIQYDYVVAKGYHCILPVLTAMFLFEILKRARTGEKIKQISMYISRISFAIYFIHICIMEGLVILIRHFHLPINFTLRLVVLEIVSVIGSIIIIMSTQRIGWIRRYLYRIE